MAEEEGLHLLGWQGTKNKWLWNIWNSKRLESEYGDCPKCGKENIEICIWRLGDGTIKKLENCPDCSAKYKAEEEAKEKLLEKRVIDDARLYGLGISGIPPKFMGCSFNTFDKSWQDKALAFCKKYADDFPVDKRPLDYHSLYLWSQQSWGVGKTHLSCAIAHRIFERWTGGNRGCPRIYFVSESDLFRQIQATYSFNREEAQTRDSEDDIIRKLTCCDLLILDDVGKERRSDARFIQRTLFGLIDGRYKLQLPMILTANVNADGLKAHLEGASFDRFFEMIGGKSVCMDGDSYRRVK